MKIWRISCALALVSVAALCSAQSTKPSDSANASSSRSKKTIKTPASEGGLDIGNVANGVYRNKSLGLTCKIPAGWVLRTDEMNVTEDSEKTPEKNSAEPSPQRAQRTAAEPTGRVLLAAFSRPPEAKGEDVNGSIVIAAEPVSVYPGLTEAVQYLGPLDEVAKAQGFTQDEDPYEIALGAKTVVRADFHKNVGSRVMRQSSLVFLAKAHAVSITMIGGTEDEVEELVDGVEFGK